MMRLRKLPYLCAIPLCLLTACKFAVDTVDLNIVVADDSGPLAGVSITVDGKKIGESDIHGHFETIVATQGKNLLVSASDPDLDNLHLSQSVEVSVYRSLFEKKVPLVFHLPKIDSKSKVITQEDDTPPAEDLVHSNIRESDLPPLPTPTPPPDTIANTTLNDLDKQPAVAVATPSATPTPESVTLKQEERVTPAPTPPAVPPEVTPRAQSRVETDGLTIETFVDGTPLSGTSIFVGRSATHSMTLLGKTGPDGKLHTDLPRELLGETLLARQSCCLPLMRPLAQGSGSKNLRVDLSKGSGQDIFVMTYAYGIGHGLENIQLQGNGGQIDSSNSVGFLLVPQTSMSNTLTVRSRDILGEEIKFTSQIDSTTPEKPVTLFVPTRQPAKPSIALFEDVDHESSQWRRFRRDFQARFLQTAVLKPLIGAEFFKIAHELALDPQTLASQGWEFTPLKDSIDFVIHLKVKSGFISLSVVDRTGQSIYAHPNIDLTTPEKSSLKEFHELIANLPFEGSVVSVSNNIATINFGANSGRQLRVGQTFQFFGNGGDPHVAPTHMLGGGTIEKINDATTEIKILGEQNKVTSGTLAVRKTEEDSPFAKRETTAE